MTTVFGCVQWPLNYKCVPILVQEQNRHQQAFVYTLNVYRFCMKGFNLLLFFFFLALFVSMYILISSKIYSEKCVTSCDMNAGIGLKQQTIFFFKGVD